MTVKWTAEIAAESLQEWAKKEITQTAERYEAFLKFFLQCPSQALSLFQQSQNYQIHQI